MSRIELDVRNIATVKALHIYLAYRLDLPAHYGMNLDALHDMLSAESRDTALCLIGTGEAQGELAAYMPRLVRVLEDAAQANDRIRLEVK